MSDKSKVKSETETETETEKFIAMLDERFRKKYPELDTAIDMIYESNDFELGKAIRTYACMARDFGYNIGYSAARRDQRVIDEMECDHKWRFIDVWDKEDKSDLRQIVVCRDCGTPKPSLTSEERFDANLEAKHIMEDYSGD